MTNQFPIKEFTLTQKCPGGKLEHQFFYSAVSSTPKYRMFERPDRKEDQEALKGHECIIATDGDDAVASARRVLRGLVKA